LDDVDIETLTLGHFDDLTSDAVELIAGYLKTKAHSPGALLNARSFLSEFFSVVGKHPLDVKKRDWIFFAEYLNHRPKKLGNGKVAYGAKKTIRSTISSFFTYIEWMCDDEGFHNPIPITEYAGLTQDSPEDVRIKRNKPKKIIPDATIKAILDAAKKLGYMYYVMFLLLAHCGMRVVEMLTIRRSDVHLKERWLETGLEPGARKSNKFMQRRIIYCFNDSVKYALKQYLAFAKPSEWLFPSPRKIGTHCKTLKHQVESLNKTVNLHFTSHWFRKTLNHNRRYRMHCPREDRQKLINHITSDAIEFYDEAEIANLRDLYDQFHPYSDF
jgi:integrase